jgi:hypothetical protein
MVYLQNIVDQWVTGRWLKEMPQLLAGAFLIFRSLNSLPD